MGVKVTRIATAGQQLAGGSTLDATYSGTSADVTTGLPIDGLLDVNAATPADNDVLTWDDGAGEWIAAPGGGGPDVELVTVAAAGATETVDVSVARTYDLTLTADCTLTLTGAVAGEAWFVTLLIRQDGTGGWDVTWPGSVEWATGGAPTIDPAINALTVVTLGTVDGGTVWLGFPTGSDNLTVISPAQLTANTDNWNPTGLDTADVIRASTDDTWDLTGIVAPAAAKTLLVVNVGTQELHLVHDATSTAANRFICPETSDLTLGEGESAWLFYDMTTARWRVVEVAGGGGATTLDALTDVDTTGKSDQDVLTWDLGSSTWVAAAGASGSVATDAIWDAKGDLAVGSNANAASRLAVGSNTYVLTADSTAPLGVTWAAPSAGGSLATLPLPMVQSKTFTTSGVMDSTPTNGNTIIFLGGLNNTSGDSSSVTQTGVTWTKIYGTGSTNPSGSIWIGLVGSGASTTVTTNSGIYFTVFEFTGQPWTPSLVASEGNANSRPHIYIPSSSSSDAVIWVGLNSGGVTGTGSPGEGLQVTGTAIALGCMMPGGLSIYAMHGSCARSFYVEIT